MVVYFLLMLLLLGVVVLITIALILLMGLRSHNRRVARKIWRRLQSPPQSTKFHPAMVAGLPMPVQRYFLHAIAPGTPIATSVDLKMQGRFRFSLTHPWISMQAKELLSRRGFIWQATIGRGLSQFQGADYYYERRGRMQFALGGLLPIVDVQTADTARSAIGRLAVELMWLPTALLPQQGVEWRAIDDNFLEAQLTIDDEPVKLTFQIDAEGRLLAGSGLRWGDQTSDRHWDYLPMGGYCSAECTFAGVTIPTQVSVGWHFGTEQFFEFFQATIDQADFFTAKRLHELPVMPVS
ncbi:DUF6544 family protein [Alkalinema sp. FACHB-956]|uniref:DUF6920 family protein n=1 Tax=Alkalinema sp. FACHB-956 TaxID=2692768 RepID=UPI001F5561D7|nr:DUF6544 family protein [Alkalinema sp. FACHB-956]